MNDQIKQRRERLIWVIIAIIFIFVLLNSMGIFSTGHFEPGGAWVQTQQERELSDANKEFWIEWDKTFGWLAPTNRTDLP